MEIIISWVSLKKPNLKTVKRLCNAIDPTSLPCSYLEHAAAIINILGYKVTLKTDKGKKPNNHNHNFKKKVSVELKYDVRQLSISFECGGYYHHYNQDSRIVVNEAGVRVYCYEGDSSATPLLSVGVYGTTKEGKHIPFHTDPISAISISVADISLICH